tara:strand:+ start:3264 stop:3503 length:240 start_codon:yes stop_codon:yes gene_type:complete
MMSEELYECFAYYIAGAGHHNCKKKVSESIHRKYSGNCSKECEANVMNSPNLFMSSVVPSDFIHNDPETREKDFQEGNK